MSRPLFGMLLVVIAAGAAGLRFAALDLRPMHGDEAVHAVKLHALWERGEYVYDPDEYHGPALYYATLPVLWLCGVGAFADFSEPMLRIVPALFGVGLILLLPLIADGIGRPVLLVAAVLTALSAAMSFYSRYYIQETLLVFFTLAAIACGWRYVCTRRVLWCVLCGAAIGLMHATKETCIIAFGSMAAAVLVARCWPAGRAELRDGNHKLWRHAGIGAAVAIGVSVLLYSAFLSNARGPLDSILTVRNYFARAGGGGLHDHRWWYYLRMLAYTRNAPGPFWSEGLILALAAAGLIAAFTGRGIEAGHVRFTRFVGVYAVLMTLIYAAIPYKTPWCMLSFVQPLILLAGVGAVAVLRWLRRRALRVAAGFALLVGVVHLGVQAWRTNLDARYQTDYRNPYVYAQPIRKVLELDAWIDKLARVHPDGRDMLVRVIASDPWPLPWYLREMRRVGYWDEPQAEADAPVVIVSGDLREAQEPLLAGAYQSARYGVRPGVAMFVYVRRDLYEAFADSQTPGSRPAVEADP